MVWGKNRLWVLWKGALVMDSEEKEQSTQGNAQGGHIFKIIDWENERLITLSFCSWWGLKSGVLKVGRPG